MAPVAEPSWGHPRVVERAMEMGSPPAPAASPPGGLPASPCSGTASRGKFALVGAAAARSSGATAAALPAGAGWRAAGPEARPACSTPAMGLRSGAGSPGMSGQRTPLPGTASTFAPGSRPRWGCGSGGRWRGSCACGPRWRGSSRGRARDVCRPRIPYPCTPVGEWGHLGPPDPIAGPPSPCTGEPSLARGSVGLRELGSRCRYSVQILGPNGLRGEKTEGRRTTSFQWEASFSGTSLSLLEAQGSGRGPDLSVGGRKGVGFM